MLDVDIWEAERDRMNDNAEEWHRRVHGIIAEWDFCQEWECVAEEFKRNMDQLTRFIRLLHSGQMDDAKALLDDVTQAAADRHLMLYGD